MHDPVLQGGEVFLCYYYRGETISFIYYSLGKSGISCMLCTPGVSVYLRYEPQEIYTRAIGDSVGFYQAQDSQAVCKIKGHWSNMNCHLYVLYITIHNHMYQVYYLARCDRHSIPYLSCLTCISTYKV